MKRLFFGAVVLSLFLSAVPAQGAGLQEPEIASECAAVADGSTGEILYAKNGAVQCYPASITKLLTALVVVENSDLEDTVIFSHDAVYDVEEGSGNPIQLEAGDKLTVEECLYAMLLESSNQAANALAEHVAGSRDAFAIYMNGLQEELGCKNSTFVNPSGLQDPEQLTTAEDMVRIAQAVFENETLQEICSAKEYRLPATLNNPEGYVLHMEHQLLNGEESAGENGTEPYEYALAGKTGYTSAAGNTLVTSAEKDGHQLIAVVLKSEQTHYEDTVALLDYGFSYLEREESLQAKAAAAEAAALQEQKAELETEAENAETVAEAEAAADPEEEPGTPASAWPLRVLGISAVLTGGFGMYAHIRASRARKRKQQLRRRREARYRAERARRSMRRRRELYMEAE